MLRAITVLALFLSAAFAQKPADSSHLYHRVLARVPMVGKGTFDDPRRPMFGQ